MSDVLINHLLKGICLKIKCDELISNTIKEFWTEKFYYIDLNRINPIYRKLFDKSINKNKLFIILTYIVSQGSMLPGFLELDAEHVRMVYVASYFLLEEYYNIPCPLDPNNLTFKIRHNGYIGYDKYNGISLRELCNIVMQL